MKSETNKTCAVPESRKIRKPLMEKKRRARINDSLETLKQILLESKTTLKESTLRKNGQRTAKLEKADILEMTVSYLQHLHSKLSQLSDQPPTGPSTRLKEDIQIRAADSSCDNLKIGVTLVPTRLDNGEIAFFVPAKIEGAKREFREEECPTEINVWRPW